MLLGQLLPGRVEVDAVALGDRLGRPARSSWTTLFAHGAIAPSRDRQRRVGHDQLGVDLHLRAQPGAALARAVRRVEREDPRLELDQRRPVLGAGEPLGEREHRARLRAPRPGRSARRPRARPWRRSRATLARIGLATRLEPAARSPTISISTSPSASADRRLDRVGQALAHVVAHHQPVDDDRDVVLVALVEHDRLLEHAHAVVDLHAREAVGAQLVEQLAVLALAPAHDRREHHEARALAELHHLVDDLLGRLADDRPAADRAVRLAHARPQQAQVVVDLGDRADRRARVARGRLLVDRDRRREPLDRVHVGLVHLPEELPGVGRQRLDVAPLPLGVDRVEREARLARARQPRDHHQRVARQRQRDVFEVVLARSRDDDLIAVPASTGSLYCGEQMFAFGRPRRRRSTPRSPRTPRRSASAGRPARSSRPDSGRSPRASRRSEPCSARSAGRRRGRRSRSPARSR